MQAADAMVADVADEQRPVPIEHDAVRLSQLRLSRGGAVAAEAGDPGPGHRADDVCRSVDPANHMAVALDHIKVAGGIEAQLVRHVQRGGDSGATVAAVTSFAVAGDRGELHGLQVEAANPLVV